METPPEVLAEAVAKETADSQVLWSARPDYWLYARGEWPKMLFGLPFIFFGLGFFWNSSGHSFFSNSGTLPLIFPLSFTTLGFCMFFSPVAAMWKAERVFYVVSDQRAIIFEKVWSIKIRSFDSSGFGGFERVSRGGSAGDIIFDRNIERRGKGTRVTETGFIGLKDYEQAERALSDMMALKRKNG